MKYPNIEAERERKGMKRSGVAEALGVERDTYSAWVNGEYPIPANFLLALCKLFRCSADYLLAPDERDARWKNFYCLNDFERRAMFPVTV